MEWTAPVGVNIHEDKRLGRIRQANGDFRKRRVSELFDALGIFEAQLEFAVVDRDPEMLDEVVAEVAVDPRADSFANVAQIDNADIDVWQASLTDRQ